MLLAAIGAVALPHVRYLPWPLTIFFFVLLFWRGLGVWHPRYLPKGIAILVLTVLAIALLYSQHQGVWGRAAGTAVFVVALGLKLMELNHQRDVYLISYLAFIVAASQFLYQQNMAMAVYTLLACCMLLAVLVSVNSGQSANKVALRTSGALLLQALPLAAAIFVLFPRLQAPAWLLMNNDKPAQSGLSDTLEPGSINRLAMSPQLAFRVKFKGAPPPRNQLYWRGPVFSFTDGAAWKIMPNDHVLHYQDRLEFSGQAYQYTLLMEPQSRNWVYALDMPARFDAPLQRNGNYQLTTPGKPDQAAEYALTSYPKYNTGYITKTEYRQNLQLPREPSARIVDLVQQLHGFEGRPEMFIQQVLAYFRQQHFSYSLQPPLMQNNPVETFLFEVRSGFCNHYATAFAYLMRVADIPARVVAGYQGGEFNSVGQFLEIRQANAHAWTEVWLKGRGWVRIDPTTAILPDRVEQEINVDKQVQTGSLSLTAADSQQDDGAFGLKQAGQFWNSLDYHWQRRIVGYGGANSAGFLSGFGMSGLIEPVFWMLASIGLAMLILAGLLLRPRRQPEDPALVLYRQFCRKMAKYGVFIKVGEGAHDFAVRASAQKPEYAELIDEITRIFVKLRYQREISRQDVKLLDNRIRLL